MNEPRYKLYVWRGEGVLENYTTGMVVIIATSYFNAWMKLSKADPEAYYNLRSGGKCRSLWVSTEDSAAEWQEAYEDWKREQREDGETILSPITPTEYELDQAPVSVQRGGG